MKNLETIHYRDAQITIGTSWCRPEDPRFECCGPVRSHLLVFPRTSVGIASAEAKPVVADRNTVLFYNRLQTYRRRRISRQGDRCEWLAVGEDSLRDAIAPYDPEVRDRDRPFALSHGPCDSAVYLRQRQLVEHLRLTPCPDPLLVEEKALAILSCAIAGAYRVRRGRLRASQDRRRAARAHADLAEAAKSILAEQFRDRLSVAEIARQVYSSPYHLSRVFRQQTGMTLHAYLNQLRLRLAVDELTASGRDLTDLALDLGFSHHSHFTQAFRRTFGVPPSRLRTTLGRLAPSPRRMECA